ncbi:hypothetical protein BN8_04017 [Fibrisoma limi BUZ 3]|uniref:Uncharacterized protein n=1 Tax=Fibrisoma limi BUZ 3 TaxID=1185876 RepID=I2GLN5_9BACT|nr:hypothetical protein BN8_04017 [Fibrisoma limi BUZ 3]
MILWSMNGNERITMKKAGPYRAGFFVEFAIRQILRP